MSNDQIEIHVLHPRPADPRQRAQRTHGRSVTDHCSALGVPAHVKSARFVRRRATALAMRSALRSRPPPPIPAQSGKQLPWPATMVSLNTEFPTKSPICDRCTAAAKPHAISCLGAFGRRSHPPSIASSSRRPKICTLAVIRLAVRRQHPLHKALSSAGMPARDPPDAPDCCPLAFTFCGWQRPLLRPCNRR